MTIFTVIFPILLIAASGYVAMALGLFSKQDGDTLSRFTFGLLIPALLFVSTARTTFNPEQSLEFLAAYYTGVLAVYGLGLLLARLLFGCAAREQSVFAMGCAYSNTTIVGIPVVAQAMGEAALLPLFLIISIQNLVMFTVGTIAAERTQLSAATLLGSLGRLVKQLLGSPITASLILGLVVNLAGIAVWDPLFNSLELLSRAAVPASLFVLGMTLKQYRLGHQLLPASVMTVVSLVVLPLLVWVLMFRVFDVETQWGQVGVLAAAMPVGISAYVFANRYQTGHGAVAAGALLSALCAIGTLTVVLLLLGV